ncbi:replication protein A 70 kDa DNA-binding subunit B-like [Panicum hallii]|uniref:replication protein A 70 kDa DNA-binding subunit B-like n=1 Tax=Panicum hallii TaxID=206008 RepID=UPI000DF4CF0A|nr:replication protein A 70 kDa DNA-binding subunit B-like [Panicum hallii]
MISFTRWTTVDEVVEIPPAFLEFTYSLTPIEKLPSVLDNKEYFTDVLGAVTKISDALPLRPRSQQVDTMKRTVTVCDESGASLDVTLWGERATSFPAEQLHKDGQHSPQIVIFVGTLVRGYAGTISLSGGSSCKWYINPDVPEAKNLIASMKSVHQPVALAPQVKYSEPRTSIAEHKKVSDIKYLHPFKNKKVEWLVTVKIMKIDKSWWYESCKKCFRTTRPHGNTYKCSNPTCSTIGAPTPRYKLVIIAGDETGDTEFVMFGRIAQHNTISSGNVSFQVNTIVAEIDDSNPVPLTPVGSQSSSAMLSHHAGSSVECTPEKGSDFTLPSPSARSQATHASSTTPSKTVMPDTELPTTPRSSTKSDKNKAVQDKDNRLPSEGPVTQSLIVPTYSTPEAQQSTTKKRNRASLERKTARKIVLDDGGKNDSGDDSAAPPTGPRYYKLSSMIGQRIFSIGMESATAETEAKAVVSFMVG